MFGLRDQRPVTPTASPLQRSASRVLTLQTPQLHEERVPDVEKGTKGQSDDGVNEIETETLAQIADQVVGDGRSFLIVKKSSLIWSKGLKGKVMKMKMKR